MIWQLLKPAYGISDAPRRWHEALGEGCRTLGARSTNLEQAIKKWNADSRVGGTDRTETPITRTDGILVEHVDDLVYAGSDQFFKKFLEPLKKKFPFGSEDDAVVGFKYVGCILKQQPNGPIEVCLLYTSPSPRDATLSRMPSSA